MGADKKEWDETLELLVQGNDTVSSDLSIGTVVTLSESLFQQMIQEINQGRIKNRASDEEVELIMVSVEDEEKDSDVADED